MTKPIRTALIGAGYIADWHAEALKMTPGAELTAVCDLSEGAAKALAQAHGAKAFTDLNEMLASNICDAVHILTPPDSHAALAKICLEAGVHCLIEKPVALSVEDTKSIQEAADKAGKKKLLA